MSSPQSRAIRAGIERERPNPDRSLRREREAWEAASLDADPVPGVSISASSVGGVRGRWLTPSDEPKAAPLVWCHGGGLTTGSSLTHRPFAARLAAATLRRTFVPDYRLLPEHTIDEPLDDLSSVLDGLARTHPEVLLGGDSSGAALAVSCTIDRVRGGRSVPKAIVSLSGAFDATLSGASIDAGRDPQLDRQALTPWQRIVGAVCDLDDWRLSPLFADLKGLPPVFLLCGQDEVWRSDSERMARRLSEAGGEHELLVVEGMWHAWPLWGDFPESRDALDRIASWLDRTGPSI